MALPPDPERPGSWPKRRRARLKGLVLGVALVGLTAGTYVVIGLVALIDGPEYEQRDGPRLTSAERPSRYLQYENDLDYVCDGDSVGGEARTSARILIDLLATKPDYLFRKQVATSDDPIGSLDEDVTVREYARTSIARLKNRSRKSKGRRSLCFQRFVKRIKRAVGSVP